MNRMKEVAQMLGVEIGEEFKIKDDERIYKLDETSAYYKLNNRDYWKRTDYTLTNLLSGKLEIIKIPQQPILDDVEKKYLSGVIRPWKNEVESICKFKSDFNGYEFLVIKVKTEVGINTTTLPYFKQGTMYKSMKVNKEYSLEELEL